MNLNIKNKSISSEYDYVGDFYNGLAIAKKDGKYGVINKEGKEITDFKYNYIAPFHQKLAEVELDGKYGFINREGKEYLASKYIRIK